MIRTLPVLLAGLLILSWVPAMAGVNQIDPGLAGEDPADPASPAAGIAASAAAAEYKSMDLSYYAKADETAIPGAGHAASCPYGGNPDSQWADHVAETFFRAMAEKEFGSICADSGRTIPKEVLDQLVNEQAAERTLFRLAAGISESSPLPKPLAMVLLGSGLVVMASFGKRFFRPG